MRTTSSAVRTFTLAPTHRHGGVSRHHVRSVAGTRSRAGCPRARVAPSGDHVTDELRGALAAVAAGADVPGYVRRHIGVSWRRSLESGLTPDHVEVPFDPDVEDDGLLARAARPVLDQLATDLAGSRVAVLLTNERGQVVDRRVPEPWLLTRLDRIGLAPGYVYAEDVVGTNGMGTALAQRSAAAVEGAEHFADDLTGLACAGSPISDPRSGRTLGVIDITCLAGDGSALMLPFVVGAGREIEQRLVDDSRLSERLAVQRFLQERRRAKGPLVLITDRTMITNAAADRMVVPQDESLLREHARGLSRGEHGDASTVVLSGGAEVTVRAEPIVAGGGAAGTALRLTPVADGRRDRSRTGRGSAAFGWESLTDTERSVIDLVAQGLTNREAAERLFLSHHTVGFHLRSIYRKLGVTSRVDLTRLAVEHQTDGERMRGLTRRDALDGGTRPRP